MKFFIALIALFFKAYAVEADIRLLAFVLSASSRPRPGRGSLCLGWTRKDSTRRVASFIRLESLSGTIKKSLSSFGLLLATRGGYLRVSQSDVHFLVMGILDWKVWNSRWDRETTSRLRSSPYTRDYGLHFCLGPPPLFFSTFLFLLSLVWNRHHYTWILSLAAGLVIPP